MAADVDVEAEEGKEKWDMDARSGISRVYLDFCGYTGFYLQVAHALMNMNNNTLFIFMSTGRRDYSYSWIPDVMTTHTQQYKLPKDELSYSL